ncbi:MAG TPA: arginase family protein [Acidimicrobiia bacterium]|nr:arginase family protein [Acidimicrobiia bacterium]
MFHLIGVPIDSAGTAGGTELAPAAFRSLGLGEALGSRDGGDLDVRIRAERRDPATGVVGLDDVIRTTSEIRGAVAEVARSGDTPFLVGGCCALVPGALAGLADAGGTVGLAHLDGHLDLYDEKSSPLGEAADMPVAVALGLGPAGWVEAAGRPLTPGATWIVGYRDREESLADGMVMPEDFDPPVNSMSTDELRRSGPARSGREVADGLAAAADGYWVHLDLDIVDPALFFANDAPVPDGIDWDELTELMTPLLRSPALAGVSLGCYNPEKDHDGENGRRIVQVFADALR